MRHSRGLIKTLRPLNPRRGAEIGVWRGGNAAILLRIFPDLHLILVDRWQPYSEREKQHDPKMGANNAVDFESAFSETMQATKFAEHRRTVLRMDSHAAAEQVVNDLDFVFLDACHDAQSLQNDLRCWVPKVRPGGVVAGHDYNGYMDRHGWFSVKSVVDAHVREMERVLRLESGHVWWYEQGGSTGEGFTPDSRS